MVLLPAPAAGDELDTLTLVFSTSLSRDANVFRRPDSSPPPTGFSNRSDLIGVVAAGVHIDKPYGQQRFQLEATGTYTRYNTFSFLDFGTFEYRGAWLWQLTPRLGGVLSAERKQSLVPFADFQGFERNLSTTDSRDFHLDGWVFGGWHLLAGASQSESRTDVQFQADGSSRITAGEAGVRYVAGSGSALTVTRRSGHGDYLDRAVNAATYIDNGYRQDETELSAAWYLSGKSTLNARLTYIERSHEHFSQRNFSGTLGQLDYTWTPTGKLRLAFSAKRDIGSWWDQGSATASSSYRVTDSLAFAPAWQVDAKVAVRARFEHARIDYRGPVGADFRPARGDTLRGAQVAVDWFPMRYLSVSFSVERDSRASNNPMYEFGDTISGLSVLMKF
jgi:exopolysaccharide biosynthesis operon protein EpsL